MPPLTTVMVSGLPALATVCELLTVYVPVLPEPVPNAVMYVLEVIPVPVSWVPTTTFPPPLETNDTVSVVPEIYPLTVSFSWHGGAEYLSGSGEYQT
jgi:hypothetical protein